ncbi:hypothetical protein D2T31_15925 [Sinirhodobacter populi]|uniref:Alkaline phosphatase n=1 Tax=Paenirhodobacter populi TaxID=2306993 RepID=A0A443K4R6_9RHOB|nr:hypothetical protein D2T31_15925 [Sinirhodobacter populi]
MKNDYTDSAASTALAAGQKTYNNAIDYDDFGQPLTNITQKLKEQGKATGTVTTVPISHATPAGFGAQNISRNNYGELSQQQIDFNYVVTAAYDWVEANSSWDETLLIVPTDHGNGLLLGPDSDTITFSR